MVLTNFFWGGEKAKEHNHPSGKLHHRRHQEGILNAAGKTLCISDCWQCNDNKQSICAPHLISILKHTRSQEGTQYVAYRGARAPQAKDKASPGKRHHGSAGNTKLSDSVDAIITDEEDK